MKQHSPESPTPSARRLQDYLFVLLQYLLPQHGLSRLIHRATRIRAPWFKNIAIRWFVRAFGVDMSQAAEPRPTAYPTFNAFFTRALTPQARPLPASGDAVACPVDGCLAFRPPLAAGRKRWLGRRPHVRGTAMNPIDHPHGGGEGRTSGGRHPVTPWGKPTKGARTRNKNKASSKLIIRSRHAKKKGR